ncbi:histidine phosphatase family protein [Aeromicrobium sp.]|nr:histidine phosphatase family protein [Candidatus Saccharibacteria bacterium]
MNHLRDITSLKNRYYIMRHGQSKANLQQIIVSLPRSDSREDYGLTELGREQVRASIANSSLTADTIIITSGFSRATETSDTVRAVLGAAEIQVTDKLRERNFGSWERPITQIMKRYGTMTG